LTPSWSANDGARVRSIDLLRPLAADQKRTDIVHWQRTNFFSQAANIAVA
jgi:hypothetical protein